MKLRQVIPCLDINNGRVVKGIRFEDLRDAGDPIAQAQTYEMWGADALAMLDITATVENRAPFVHLVAQVSKTIQIPIVVGGGIRNEEDVRALLDAGASQVSLGSSAVNTPKLLESLAKKHGSECIMVAVDAGYDAEGVARVHTHGGKKATPLEVVEWCKEVEKLGVGEILLTSIDKDGTQLGFDIPLLERVCKSTSLPVIASGGAGKVEHFVEAFKAGAQSVLAASLFHFRTLSIEGVKAACEQAGFAMQQKTPKP
ncbi:MAG: imidazole glycerol phosphate synthase cyclase subunit [Proteobacteria bacterium]|nr:imidazole glycerol phosphate synthase cyclase subunit [Cystobacterineae bacterium]MCL2258686.1 imidazole glycerol phosphate synthase cyclase subunit [Cystobacterineae bacterium]MCL2313987.1 imidazole glycerol phosphate synthase cyclase subunit [Pseudomonadota bacterium]